MLLRRQPYSAAIAFLACSPGLIPITIPSARTPVLHYSFYAAPAIHGNGIVFTSEDDLWTVGIHGAVLTGSPPIPTAKPATKSAELEAEPIYETAGLSLNTPASRFGLNLRTS